MKLKYFVLAAMLLPLAACGGKVENADPNPTPSGTIEGPGLFSGASGNLRDAFGRSNAGGSAATLPVNAFLWRAALETVSFLPIEEVDSAGGVITTSWAVNPDNANERSRINVLVLGLALSPQALQVRVFNQERVDGEWREAAPNTATAAQLEETILTKARKLRIREQAAY